MTVEFGDLPSGFRVRGPAIDWASIAEGLQAQPGKWAFIGRMSASVPSHISHGNRKAIDPKKFQAVARNSDPIDAHPRKADVWMRYVGEEGEFR